PAVVAVKVRRNEALLQEALRQRPNDAHLRVHLAQTYAAARRFPEAEAELTAVLEGPRIAKVPHNLVAEYHVLRATYRLLNGQTVAVIHDLERAKALHPEWGIPYTELVRLRFNAEEWESVVELADAGRGRSFAPGVHNFRVVRARCLLDFYAGRALRKLGEPDGAAECLRRAVAIDPTLLEARLELGDLQLERAEYPAALETLEPAGKDEEALPHFAELATGIALARYMGGDEAGAQACLVPLLDLFAAQLRNARDVDPMQLAEAALRAGQARAARNLVSLFQHSLQAEAA
ncbi:MAG TPA: tetratricopeptide repeat protein, partial [Longimicrobiaceae bacterium]|nr:tetratricopeptide repeat protein [Longimicrobiaceae bacterium]